MSDHHKVASFDAKIRRVTLAQYGFVMLIAFAGIWYSLMVGRAETFIYPICLALVTLAAWSVWSWKYATGRLLDPYMLFFVAAFLFNGSIAILEILRFRLDNQMVGTIWDTFSVETKLKALYLVTLGLNSFHLGALSSLTPLNRFSAQFLLSPNLPSPKIAPQYLRLVGWLLFLISFLPTLFILQDYISVVMVSGYFGIYEQSAQNVDTGINSLPTILSFFFYPSMMFLLAGSSIEGSKGELIASLGIISLFSFIALFLGYRQRLEPLIAYVWLWHRAIKPIPRKILVVSGIVTIFFIFPFLAAIRDLPGQERLASDFLLSSFLNLLGAKNVFFLIIAEMGGSISAVAYTIDFVPSTRDFDWGFGYLRAILILVPNLFWKIHPATIGSYDSWLTWSADPVRAAKGGGLGFSFIAEAYINFGWFGAPVALGIMGFLYGKFTRWATQTEDPAKMAVIASFLSFAIHFSRGQSPQYVVRPLVWYALLPYLAVKIIDRLALRSSSKDVVTLTPQKVK